MPPKFQATSCLSRSSSALIDENQGYFKPTIRLLLREPCHKRAGYENDQICTSPVEEHNDTLSDENYTRQRARNEGYSMLNEARNCWRKDERDALIKVNRNLESLGMKAKERVRLHL